MLPIEQISYEEAMKRFRYLYRMENLPSAEVAGAFWFANDGSCAALVKVGNGKTWRIKGTVTAPELRGQGYGDAMLRHLIQEATKNGAEVIESFARNPKWYLNNGFHVKRVTKWGVTVVSMNLLSTT